VVAYHKVNQYGQQAGASGRLDPIVALWVPLVFLSALIGWMYHVLAHRPGGQPIGALEAFFARIARFAKSFVPKPRDEVADGA
jgi:lipopolysaccharide export system permease protein